MKAWPKVILFGDSLTQYSFSDDGCWGSKLADLLQRKCDVINRGFSGYNSRWNKVMLPKILDKDLAKETAAMAIFLGANDSNDAANTRQHVPLEEFTENMKDIVTYALSQGLSRDKIIIIAPPAFNALAWGEECKRKGTTLTKNNKTTGMYAKACCEVAKEAGTNIVDLYTEMMKAEDFSGYLNDGLHLSPLGSRLLFDLLNPIVEKLTSDLPQVCPYWADVDAADLETSLNG